MTIPYRSLDNPNTPLEVPHGSPVHLPLLPTLVNPKHSIKHIFVCDPARVAPFRGAVLHEGCHFICFSISLPIVRRSFWPVSLILESDQVGVEAKVLELSFEDVGVSRFKAVDGDVDARSWTLR